MIPLTAVGTPSDIVESVVGVVKTDASDRGGVFVARSEDGFLDLDAGQFLAVLTTAQSADRLQSARVPCVYGVPSLAHLSAGDIVLIHSDGRVRTLFRPASRDNFLFVTEQCNSRCLMCSQPPRALDDIAHFYSVNTRLIPLIPKTTQQIGITGGEPTLLGQRLVDLLALLKQELPSTHVHVLTNGRAFADRGLVAAIGRVAHSGVVFGVPLHSDYPPQHDYIAQAAGAFTQTVLGLHNLARYRQRVEVRIVIHRQNASRLRELAGFIYRNLPFVEHIAFMGLEYVGYTPQNSELLWIEPAEYAASLADAVSYLRSCQLDVSVYNLPLCLLPRELWEVTRQSISDWKREYLDVCRECDLMTECGGVFGTSRRLSAQIAPIRVSAHA